MIAAFFVLASAISPSAAAAPGAFVSSRHFFSHRDDTASRTIRRWGGALTTTAADTVGDGETESDPETDAAAVHFTGQAQHRLNFVVRLENRIDVLQEQPPDTLTPAERSELDGLLSKQSTFEERYDPGAFTAEHHAFKASHNDALVALARYCQVERGIAAAEGGEEEVPINVFVMDGPDGGSTGALRAAGFAAQQCYVANLHSSTCSALRIGGLPGENVACANAVDALRGDDDGAGGGGERGRFGDVDFAVYYFDGCGGYAPPIKRMLSSGLLGGGRPRNHPLAVGFSLVGGNRDVVDKEVMVVRHLLALARQRKMKMKVSHVFDDPGRYGVSEELRKIGGGTMTSWFVLEPAT